MTSSFARRRLLTGAGALAAGTLLAGCSTGGDGGSPGSRRLRAAFSAGGSQETLDPHIAPLFVDQARAKALYDSVLTYKDDMSVQARLAESWESDRSGSRWTIRLRADARFHDGSPVTAADVLWNYRRIADPATGAAAQQLFSGVDFAASTAKDRDLTLALKAPDFEFPAALGAPGTEIVPKDTEDFAEPVGSGPFRYRSFKPGGKALFTAWADHWDGGPRIAELEFVPVNDERARLNALLSGQVDYAHDLTAASAGRVADRDGLAVLRSRLSTMQAVLLRLSRAPSTMPVSSRRSPSDSTGTGSSRSPCPATAPRATTSSAWGCAPTPKTCPRANATSTGPVPSSRRPAPRGWPSPWRPATPTPPGATPPPSSPTS